MYRLIAYCIDNGTVINFITILLLSAGVFTACELQKEVFPHVDFDVIRVTSSYPGGSPEDVESRLTVPLERALKGISNVKETNSVSTENFSLISLKLRADADIEEVLNDVRNAIGTISDLPEDAKTPSVVSINNKQRSLLSVSLLGEDYGVLRQVSKRLRDRLEDIDDVTEASLSGYRVDEIRIVIDPVLMRKKGISVSDIHRSIKGKNINLSAGVIKNSVKGDIVVRTIAEFNNLEDIANLVLRSNISGGQVLLKEVANVERGPKETSILHRTNGQRSITVHVKVNSNADTLEVARNIKREIANFFANKSLAKDIKP